MAKRTAAQIRYEKFKARKAAEAKSAERGAKESARLTQIREDYAKKDAPKAAPQKSPEQLKAERQAAKVQRRVRETQKFAAKYAPKTAGVVEVPAGTPVETIKKVSKLKALRESLAERTKARVALEKQKGQSRVETMRAKVETMRAKQKLRAEADKAKAAAQAEARKQQQAGRAEQAGARKQKQAERKQSKKEKQAERKQKQVERGEARKQKRADRQEARKQRRAEQIENYRQRLSIKEEAKQQKKAESQAESQKPAPLGTGQRGLVERLTDRTVANSLQRAHDRAKWMASKSRAAGNEVEAKRFDAIAARHAKQHGDVLSRIEQRQTRTPEQIAKAEEQAGKVSRLKAFAGKLKGMLQRGKKGGQFYMTGGGQKVYVGKT
jgi:hypothetical protein